VISIKQNIDKYVNTYLKEVKRVIDKATISATNKTARQASTAAKKAVREKYTIPANKLNEATKIQTAKPKRPAAIIRVTGKRLSLGLYRALQSKKKGASAMIIKGKRVTIPGDLTLGNKTFKATMKSGHKGIFYRISPKRLKIHERTGPSAPDLMRSRQSTNAVKKYVKDNYERIYASEHKYFKTK
jgi:glutamate dehydrogenase/leucine dehydrogenase